MSRLRTISETILALERERDREEEALRGARYTVGPGRSSYALLQQRQTTPRALFGQWVTRYTSLPLFLELWLTWSPPSLLQLFARERIVLLDRISNYYKHSLDFFQAVKVRERRAGKTIGRLLLSRHHVDSRLSTIRTISQSAGSIGLPAGRRSTRDK